MLMRLELGRTRGEKQTENRGEVKGKRIGVSRSLTRLGSLEE